MQKKNNLFRNIFIILISFFVAIIVVVFVTYFIILPKLIHSNDFISSIKTVVKKELKMDLTINKPYFNSINYTNFLFGFDKLSVEKNNKMLVKIDNFHLGISFNEIFKKRINLDKFNVSYLYIDIDELLKSLPAVKETKKAKINFILTLKKSDIFIKNIKLKYKQKNSLANVLIKDVNLISDDTFKTLKFDLNANILKNNKELVKIVSNSEDSIKLYKDKAIIDDLKVYLNNSRLLIDSNFTYDKIFLNAKSDQFYLSDVFNIINSDLVVENGSILLSPINSPKGEVKFDITLNPKGIYGKLDIIDTQVNVKDLSNIPLRVSSGQVLIDYNKIQFKDLIGYYGKNKKNKLNIYGKIKDYYKTFDSNITIDTVVTNEFFKDYLSKLLNNTVLYVSKPSDVKVIYKAKNNKMHIIWLANILKGVNFGVKQEKSALSDYDRAIAGELYLDNKTLDIKRINYYIANSIKKGVKLTPILVFNTKMDLDGTIHNAGFSFGREMPCEFLNIFLGQKLFKKGTIKGDIAIIFKNGIPSIDADMEIKKTTIPSQRMRIKEAYIKTTPKNIDLYATGKFKKAKYIFNGKIKNELKPPFVINKLALEIDNLDVERILKSLNSQGQKNNNVSEKEANDNIENTNDDYMFDTNLIRIKDCDFILSSGNYKELTFGNIKADLTLDENGILKVTSNKFDIAKGFSSLDVNCDLKNLKYAMKLDVKGVDSNLMSKTLFNLDKEISGPTYGIISLYGDESLKMNGEIMFLVNGGTIGKIGLVEYLLKVASVFRNPVVMVSPSTIMDIVTVPEGKFDRITGIIKIKDNVLNDINIKSTSKTLSALIRGKFDLDRHDASLRIYTRFSNTKKSAFSALRNLSLNSLANKVKLNSQNDVNYYASELVELPNIEVEENKTQIFLTQVEGDVEHFNFLSSLKKIK